MADLRAERAVVDYALSRGYVTEEQLEDALLESSTSFSSLLPILANYIPRERLNELRAVYRRAQTSTGRLEVASPEYQPADITDFNHTVRIDSRTSGVVKVPGYLDEDEIPTAEVPPSPSASAIPDDHEETASLDNPLLGASGELGGTVRLQPGVASGAHRIPAGHALLGSTHTSPSEHGSPAVSGASDTLFGADDVEPGDTIGHYVVLEELARGGMGAVFVAKSPRLERKVALKLMLAGDEASDEQRARFRREAETLARLQHPGIVAVHDFGHHGEMPWMAMDLIEGESLQDLLDRDGPLESRAAGLMALKLSEALMHAHAQDVLHRDLKPANVLLEGRDKRPLITDFGLAKAAQEGQSLTQTGQMVGTPAFMPPEQAAGEKESIGPHTDVYSVGATLYSMLTGRPPFQGASQMNVVTKVLRTEPDPPSVHRDGIDKSLEAVCLKALEKKLERRYATAKELASDLRRYLGGEQVQAGPATGALQARRRRLLWALGVTLLIGVGLAGYAGWRSIQQAAARTSLEKLQELPRPQVFVAAERWERDYQGVASDEQRARLDGLLVGLRQAESAERGSALEAWRAQPDGYEALQAGRAWQERFMDHASPEEQAEATARLTGLTERRRACARAYQELSDAGGLARHLWRKAHAAFATEEERQRVERDLSEGWFNTPLRELAAACEELSKEEAKVLSVIRKRKTRLSRAELRKELSLRGKALDEAVSRLVERGYVKEGAVLQAEFLERGVWVDEERVLTMDHASRLIAWERWEQKRVWVLKPGWQAVAAAMGGDDLFVLLRSGATSALHRYSGVRFDAPLPEPAVVPLAGHCDFLAIDPQGRRLSASGPDNQHLQVVDLEGQEMKVRDLAVTNQVRAASFSSDGTYLVGTGGELSSVSLATGWIDVWDAKDGRLVHHQELPSAGESLAWRVDEAGPMIAVGTNYAGLLMFRLGSTPTDGEPTRLVEVGTVLAERDSNEADRGAMRSASGSFRAFGFSADGKVLYAAVGSKNRDGLEESTLRVWGLEFSGEVGSEQVASELLRKSEPWLGVVEDLVFSPSRALFLTGRAAWGAGVAVWEGDGSASALEGLRSAGE